MSLAGSKVTDNTHEMSGHELFSQPIQLRIPIFQRPYVWKKAQLERMIREIALIVDGEDKNRFLGAIIAVRRLSNPAEPQPYEIVDGQQRLTTVYLFLLGAARVAEANGHTDLASGIVNAYMIVDWARTVPCNTKLVPSYEDRRQFRKVFDLLEKTGGFSAWLSGRARLPDASGDEDGSLLKQFGLIVRHLNKVYKDQGVDGLTKVVDAVRNGLTFVFILLKDPASATTVFEGLNDPGIPIGIGDLVRNEVFSKIGDNSEIAAQVYSSDWGPFQARLGGHYDDYFFPFCVTHRPSANKADMFRELRELWDGTTDAKEIIARLDEYVGSFLAIMEGVVPASYSKEVQVRIARLVAMRRPAAVLPFVMRLLREYELGKVTSSVVVGCLDVLESFLVRRALCGIEPTGLLGLFRSMWGHIEGNPTAAALAEVINKRLTVEWPDDARLREQILTRPFYGSSICKYGILEYERALGADFPEGCDPWIEHILPQKITPDWKAKFSEQEHQQLVDTWGNLIPLSSKMNSGLGQKPYAEKRVAYEENSMFASPRRLAKDYSDWGAAVILERGRAIGDWAVTRWPRS